MVPQAGVYLFQGTLNVARYRDYATSPTLFGYTLTVAGQTLASESPGLIDPPPPPGWEEGPFNYYRYSFVKSVTTGVYLPAGPVQVQVSATGVIDRYHPYHAAGAWAGASGALTLTTPSIEITGPSQLCGMGTATMAYTARPPGGQVSNWRVSPTSIATIDQSGLLTPTGMEYGVVTVQVDYAFPPGPPVSSPPFQVLVQPGAHVEILQQETPPGTPTNNRSFLILTSPPGGTLHVVDETHGVTLFGPGVVGASIPLSVAVVDSFTMVATYMHDVCGNDDARLEVTPPPPPPPPPPPDITPPKNTGDSTDQPVVTDGKNGKDPPCCVMYHSGEEQIDRVDLVIPGRGESFVWRRRYRSRIDFDGPMGFGWDADHLERLYPQENGDVLRGDGRGRADRWVLSGGSYQAPPGFFSTLVHLENGWFVLREPNGTKRVFTPEGLLSERLDRVGNALTYERDASGKLARILDSYGRPITITWDGDRISRVTDFAGREVVYTYDENGDLVAARTPVVVGTSTGDNFPNGRTETYTYSQGFADPVLNHNIVAVVSPEEVANGGPAVLQWVYGNNPSDPAVHDRVISRTWGGTNGSGVSAGGQSSYSYELLNHELAPATGLLWTRTTVSDRNGNTRVYEFDAAANVLSRRDYTRGLRASDPPSFEVHSEFDADGQVTRKVFPEGNEVRFVHDASGPRAAQMNVLEVRRVAGPRGGGPDLVTHMTYEPLYQRLASITDPRGLFAGYVPPLGTASAERYTAHFYFDYQESNATVPEAVTYGISLASVARGLGDLNGDGRTDQVQGNVVRATAPSVLLRAESLEAARLGTTTQEILSETTWNDRGQPLASIDPEGNVSTFEYFPGNDPDGDGVLVDGVPSGEDSGYPKAVTVDATTSPRRRTPAAPTALRTSFRYDPVGNLIGVTNPRGVMTSLEVNALNEVVKITRGADVSQALGSGQLPSGEAACQYVTRLFHDHNGRVVRSEVEDRDGSSNVLGGFAERTVIYDILDHPVEVTVEVDQFTHLTTTFRYDLNENPILVTAPAGNKIRFEWDERDLPLAVIRGADTLQEARITFEVDKNGNRTRTIDAEDTDGNGQPEATTITYDGFDRAVAVIDALGSRGELEYDPASQVIRRRMLGHPAGQPGSPNVLLSEAKFSHDELGRVFRADTSLFLAQGFTTVRPVSLLDQDGDGWVTGFAEYDALSRTVATIQDDGQVSQAVFDGASRLLEAIDALGNRSTREYDKNSNPTRVTSLERSAEGLVPDETFSTLYVWDQLDRLVRATDNAGQTARFSYDSRDNLIQRSDAVGALAADPLGLFPGQINQAGNTYSYVYDGLNRLLQTICDLRQGGQGGAPLDLSNAANPDGRITLTQQWDANSRLAAIVDDKGQATAFGYDALDRKITHTYADGSVLHYVWDKDSNLRQTIDPNGSIATRTYDALNRLVQVQVQRGAAVGGTTQETYSWDGMSRLVQATDDNGGVLSVVERVWDSLSRLLEERQDGRAVSATWAGDRKRLSLTYPGGRAVAFAHDAIDRVKTITDAGLSAQLAEYSWIGPGMRPLARANGNGTALSLVSAGQDVGFDAVQRVVRLRHLLPGGAAFVDREYGYDRASNRTSERRLDDLNLIDRYSYDSAYRVVASTYDEEGQAGSQRREVIGHSYRYDGVGNRVEGGETRLVQGSGPSQALLATETVDVDHHALVTGHVAAAGPQQYTVTVGPNARVAGNATGPQVRLMDEARVDGNVSTHLLTKNATATIGGTLGPYVAPSAVPGVGAITPGASVVSAGPYQTLVLAPGSYASVELLHHSRLVLSAGTYTMNSLRVGPYGVVEIQGPVVVRVATDLTVEHHVQVQPAQGLTAADVRWETLDPNMIVGPDGVFVGSVLAPAGEVEVQHDTVMTGWIQAKKARVGPHAQVTAPGVGGGGPQPSTTTVGYAVNSVNEYTSVGGVARGHDPNGNLRDDGTRLFLYDYRNRLIGVSRKSDGAPIAAYRYDALGRRIEKVVYSPSSPGAVQKVTRFCWDGWDLIEELSAAGITESTYVCGVGVDEHVQWVRTASHPLGAGTFYLHQDARGSVVAVTDQGGAVVEKTRYDDFGRADHASAVGLALGFQGRYLDAETRLYEFRHRVYDPATGRFLQRDPVWDPANFGGQYTFVGNNPATWGDPSGQIVPLFIAIPAIIGALAGGGAVAYDAATTEDPDKLKKYQGASGAWEGVKGTVVGAGAGAAGGAAAAAVAPAGASAGTVVLADAAGGATAGGVGTFLSDVLNLEPSSASTYAFNVGAGGVAGGLVGAIARPIAGKASQLYGWLKSKIAGPDTVFRGPQPGPYQGPPNADAAQTPGQHLYGRPPGGRDYLTDSPFESWSSKRQLVAEDFAGPRGTDVVDLDLNLPLNRGRIAADLRTEAGRAAAAAQEPDEFLRGLIRGSRDDAEVIMWRTGKGPQFPSGSGSSVVPGSVAAACRR